MAGKRAKDPSLLQTDFSTARSNSAKLLTDWEGLTEARTLLVASVGNSYIQGSVDGTVGSWVDQITTSHQYIRISTDGGSNWIELPIAELADLTTDSHPALSLGTANGLSLVDASQILSLALATTTTPGAMSADDKTLLDTIRTDGTGQEILTDDGVYKVLVGDSYIGITHDTVNDEIEFAFDPTQLSITTAEGVQGGANFSSSPTLKLDINGLTALDTPTPSTDYVAVYDADAAIHKKVLLEDIGAIYTAASLGTSGDGSVILSGTVGNEFKFKRLKAGANVAITEATNYVQVDFSGTGTGENNTASNAGLSGVGLVLTKNGVDLPFKAIDAGSNKISITDDGTNKTVDIDVVPSNITHDSLGSVDANKHIDHTTVTITAGTALSGGGTIAANRTINIDYTEPAVASVVADSDLILIYDGSAHKTAPVSLLPYVTSSRTITTIEGIQGGGNLSANRTFKLDINGLTEQTGLDIANDYLVMYDGSSATHKKIALEDLPTSAGAIWGNITGTLSNQTDLQNALNAKVPTTTTVTAGTGLSGGGALSSNITLNLNIFGLTTSTPAGTDFVAITNATGSTHTKALLSSLPYPVTSVASKTGAVTLTLSDLTDVNATTPTNRNFLVADGIDWESRPMENADIPTALTGKTYNGVTLTTGGSTDSYLSAAGSYETVPTSVWVADTDGIHYSTGVRQGNIGVGLDSRSDSSIYAARNDLGWAGYFYNEGVATGSNGLKIATFGSSQTVLDAGSKFYVYGTGRAKLASYGSGTLSGTLTYYLGVDATGGIIEVAAPGGGEGVDTFLELTDTPASYIGSATYDVRVNSAATGLEFVQSIWSDAGTYIYPTSLENIYLPYNKGISFRNSTANVAGNNLFTITGGTSTLLFKAGTSEVEAASLYNANTLGQSLLTIKGKGFFNFGTSATYETDSYTILDVSANSNLKYSVTGAGTIQQAIRSTDPIAASGVGLYYTKTVGGLDRPYYRNNQGETFDLAAGIRSLTAGAGMNFTVVQSGSDGTITLGTPSTITVSSSNTASGTTHNHTLDLSGRSILTQHSITGGGTLAANRTLNLVGDVASPTASQYYGTNSSSVRGWYDLPTGGTTTVNLGYTSSTTTGTITQNTGGTNATIPAATTLVAGLLTTSDKSKLDGIQNNADNYLSWGLKVNTSPVQSVTKNGTSDGFVDFKPATTSSIALSYDSVNNAVQFALTGDDTTSSRYYGTSSIGTKGFYQVDLANGVTGLLPISKINATGTPSSSTYLRGDSTWSTLPTPTTYSAGTGLTLVGTTFSHTAHTGEVTGATALTITNGAVTEAKIGSLAVTEGKIGSLAVTEGKIGNSAVTNGKIANNAVTISKLPAGGTGASNEFLNNQGNWVTVAGTGTVTNISAGRGMRFTTTNDNTPPTVKVSQITSTGWIHLETPLSVNSNSTNTTGDLSNGHTHALGTVDVGHGGTNITSYTAGDILYATGATTLSKLAKGTNAQVLTSNGSVPTWSSPVEDIAFEFADVALFANLDYTLDLYASYNYTILGIVAETDFGTISNVNLTINGVGVNLNTTYNVSSTTGATFRSASSGNLVSTNNKVKLISTGGKTGTPTTIRGKIRYIRR